MDQDKDVRGEPDRRHTPRPWLGRRAVRGLLVMLVLGAVLGVGVMWGELRGSNRASGTKMATTPQGGPAAGDNRGAAMPGMPGMAPGKAQQGGGPSSDEQMVEVSLTPEGKILSEESTIDPSALPDAVKKGLQASKYGSWKVKKAEKVIEGEDAGKPSYEVEVTKGAEKAEVVFDPAGTVIKEEVAHPKVPHKK